jgi:quercetin dioxygenase-like cupin family protein
LNTRSWDTSGWRIARITWAAIIVIVGAGIVDDSRRLKAGPRHSDETGRSVSTKSLVVVDAADGVRFGAAGTVLVAKIHGRDSGGRVTIAECELARDQGIPYHAHGREDMSYYVLSGALTFTDQRGVRIAAAGSTIHANHGVFHSIHNYSEEPARFIVFYNPAFDESYYTALGKASSGEPKAIEELRALQQRLHITVRSAPE